MTRPARQIAFDFFQADETDQPIPASPDTEARESRQQQAELETGQQEPHHSASAHRDGQSENGADLPSAPSDSHSNEQQENGVDVPGSQQPSFNAREDEGENGIAAEIQLPDNTKASGNGAQEQPAETGDRLTKGKKEEPERPALSSPLKGAVAVKSKRGRKSLKTLSAEADLANIPDDEQLFQRQYYSIGEVATMFGVNASLLRFWESEFSIIQPMKNRKGDRHFRPVDIKNLQLIHDLLRRRKLTIEGAKTFLKNNKKSQERFDMIRSLQQIKSFLLEIKASL